MSIASPIASPIGYPIGSDRVYPNRPRIAQFKSCRVVPNDEVSIHPQGSSDHGIGRLTARSARAWMAVPPCL